MTRLTRREAVSSRVPARDHLSAIIGRLEHGMLTLDMDPFVPGDGSVPA